MSQSVEGSGSFVNANLHFHTLVPEGVWHEQADGSVTFHPLPPPTDEDVEELAARIVRRVTRLLARRDADTTGDDEVDALAQAHAEAVQPPLPHVEPRVPSRAPGRHRCALVDGFSLHANTTYAAFRISSSLLRIRATPDAAHPFLQEECVGQAVVPLI
jgi:hypothetical protein